MGLGEILIDGETDPLYREFTPIERVLHGVVAASLGAAAAWLFREWFHPEFASVQQFAFVAPTSVALVEFLRAIRGKTL